MDLWPLGAASGADGLTRALTGMGLLAFGFLLRDAAILVHLARGSEMLRFPPKRAFRPRLRSRPGPLQAAPQQPVTPLRRAALWAGVAVGTPVLAAGAAAAFLSALVVAFVALGAVGWILGPVVAGAVWALALTASVLVPVAAAADRAAAWGRLYRSARNTLARPAMLGTSMMVYSPSPLLPLVRWADRQVMRRVDVTAGPAPWAEQPSRRRRAATSASRP